jgi:hypothetical protein
MTIAFMAMVAAIIAERISLRAGLWLLPILLTVGLGSVLQWYISEARGAGDLRFYAAVQTYSALVLLLGLAFSEALHTLICLGGCGGLVRFSQSPGESRQANLRSRTHGKRPHPQAPGRCRCRLLDPSDAREAATSFGIGFELSPLGE